MYSDEEFDPYEAAQDYYEKYQRGTLSRRGGNFDWIATDNKRLQVEFFEELQRLFGPKYKIRMINDCFSVEELSQKTIEKTQKHSAPKKSLEDEELDR